MTGEDVGGQRDGGGMTKTYSRAEIGALGEQLAVDHLRERDMRAERPDASRDIGPDLLAEPDVRGGVDTLHGRGNPVAFGGT